MTGDPRPLLALEPPTVTDRPSQRPRDLPRVSKLGGARQSERLTPQFQELTAAFQAERARLGADLPDEVDPALVLVMDLVGSIKDFGNAISKIAGLEFLTELLGERAEEDDDFHMVESDGTRVSGHVPHSLYLVMSNIEAVNELVGLFELWKQDPTVKLEHGLGKFKDAFRQLAAIRRWGPEDRVRETGLLEYWREKLEVVGQAASTVEVEVELWFRSTAEARRTAEQQIAGLIEASGGRIIDRCQIAAIGYHALLAELPIQQVRSVLETGAGSIRLLTADAVMFVSPFVPMTVAPGASEPSTDFKLPPAGVAQGLPRIALLDGLPLGNHVALSGRLLIDDPDAVSSDYAVSSRHHGTAMASLIIHGDLSRPEQPLDRPVYVRPIMRPHEFLTEHEQVIPTRLFTDLLHRAVRRIVEGEGEQPAAAPSVRLVNISIGDARRALVRRMSPVGRLLDWLAHTYNLLFIVSAGNHAAPITIPASAAVDREAAQTAATQAVYSGGILRSILPPGDALNALTIGATHRDGLDDFTVPDTAWDLLDAGAPSLFSAKGPGVDRSVKPDLHHIGGRELYARPVIQPGNQSVELEPSPTAASGPGVRVAAPGSPGATTATAFSTGTSIATALVTREASRLFDVLEAEDRSTDDLPLPDAQYHPLLVRALLAHASGWGAWDARLRNQLGLESQDARRKLTAFLGYGELDPSRLGTAATNRAVLIAGGTIARDRRHTYEIPLPVSLRARAEWHRVTITLASMAPTVGTLMRYRAAKVYFATPETALLAGDRIEAEHYSVRRGSLQHEIVEGRRAMAFSEGESFPVHVECMDDAQRLRAGMDVRYALVVSVETAVETSSTIHNEVREALRQRARDRVRGRVTA